ncbi:uncharacterized protein MONOS_4069 [Monocercomonoides exilis]|uniref:uncharacterized protein n=1 Tax=Monocercomonoides exilis TaxID=2049356 RepID=UPI00355AAD0E|nr:hypothetical protein MONOS_4069 [Monocercomonoides exilis]|eukprot:MONOS_4069.1-p1 / transcript=MONOS_4069.1 / gene=MONOS_4069 / organism=Monocercomonoides_exilis_PA203 / gene_product=unspecified product / transcript_product=unspecified product / location=Mono_scaffold00103:103038-103751(-) / protein_length=238 / sequence_SO=supercontig / SO=protein_coding / is_pseudo=false
MTFNSNITCATKDKKYYSINFDSLSINASNNSSHLPPPSSSSSSSLPPSASASSSSLPPSASSSSLPPSASSSSLPPSASSSSLPPSASSSSLPPSASSSSLPLSASSSSSSYLPSDSSISHFSNVVGIYSLDNNEEEECEYELVQFDENGFITTKEEFEEDWNNGISSTESQRLFTQTNVNGGNEWWLRAGYLNVSSNQQCVEEISDKEKKRLNSENQKDQHTMISYVSRLPALLI